MTAVKPDVEMISSLQKQRNKHSVYRSKLRETVVKPNHTADRRKVSISNGTGRSSTRNSVWMVKTDSEDAFAARKPDQSAS